MQNLIQKLHNKNLKEALIENSIKLDNINGLEEIIIKVVALITNNKDAFGIERAKALGMESIVLDHKSFCSRESFDDALGKLVECFKPDLILLAGFMRILTPVFVDRFQSKILNIHPSLLPHHKGANGIKDSFLAKYGAGVSIHFVTNQLDSGEIILQKELEIRDNEDFENFKQRVHSLEYELYPKAVLKVLLDRELNSKERD